MVNHSLLIILVSIIGFIATNLENLLLLLVFWKNPQYDKKILFLVIV